MHTKIWEFGCGSKKWETTYSIAKYFFLTGIDGRYIETRWLGYGIDWFRSPRRKRSTCCRNDRPARRVIKHTVIEFQIHSDRTWVFLSFQVFFRYLRWRFMFVDHLSPFTTSHHPHWRERERERERERGKGERERKERERGKREREKRVLEGVLIDGFFRSHQDEALNQINNTVPPTTPRIQDNSGEDKHSYQLLFTVQFSSISTHKTSTAPSSLSIHQQLTRVAVSVTCRAGNPLFEFFWCGYRVLHVRLPFNQCSFPRILWFLIGHLLVACGLCAKKKNFLAILALLGSPSYSASGI